MQQVPVLAAGADQEGTAHRADPNAQRVVEDVVRVGLVTVQMTQDLALQAGGRVALEVGGQRGGTRLSGGLRRLRFTGARRDQQRHEATGQGLGHA